MKYLSLVSVAFALNLALATGVACAADPPGEAIAPPSDYRHLKLGLWEETISSDSGSAPRIPAGAMDLSNLSPEERARVEAVLKHQAEQAKAAGGAPRVTTKTKQFCIRQADIDAGKGSMFHDKQPGKDDHCTTRETARTASRVAMKAECEIHGARMTTDVTYEIRSPTEFAGAISSSGSYNGQPMKSSQSVSARWTAADCGTVK